MILTLILFILADIHSTFAVPVNDGQNEPALSGAEKTLNVKRGRIKSSMLPGQLFACHVDLRRASFKTTTLPAHGEGDVRAQDVGAAREEFFRYLKKRAFLTSSLHKEIKTLIRCEEKKETEGVEKNTNTSFKKWLKSIDNEALFSFLRIVPDCDAVTQLFETVKKGELYLDPHPEKASDRNAFAKKEFEDYLKDCSTRGDYLLVNFNEGSCKSAEEYLSEVKCQPLWQEETANFYFTGQDAVDDLIYFTNTYEEVQEYFSKCKYTVKQLEATQNAREPAGPGMPTPSQQAARFRLDSGESLADYTREMQKKYLGPDSEIEKLRRLVHDRCK